MKITTIVLLLTLLSVNAVAESEYDWTGFEWDEKQVGGYKCRDKDHSTSPFYIAIELWSMTWPVMKTGEVKIEITPVVTVSGHEYERARGEWHGLSYRIDFDDNDYDSGESYSYALIIDNNERTRFYDFTAESSVKPRKFLYCKKI